MSRFEPILLKLFLRQDREFAVHTFLYFAIDIWLIFLSNSLNVSDEQLIYVYYFYSSSHSL